MKKIIMVGTSLNTMGGIASVIRVYQAAGLFERYGIAYLATHCDGGIGKKLAIMSHAYLTLVIALLRGQVFLLHVHVASRASFWRKSGFFLLARCFGVPTILHLHGAEFAQFYEKECGALRQRFIRYVFDGASRVVVLSEAWRLWVAGISRNRRIETIFNPVILPPAVTPWTERQPGSVLSLGRLGKRKGTYDLLDAGARSGAAVGALKLMLGGDGEVEQARARAVALGTEAQLDLLGWVSGADRERYLGLATVYALPSYNEGLPMSILEAMAAGLPVLSTPVGGIPEAVTDGVEGYLVAPGDIDALAARLQQLLLEPGLASRMGAAARRKVESTFSSDAVLPRVERLYAELGYLPR